MRGRKKLHLLKAINMKNLLLSALLLSPFIAQAQEEFFTPELIKSSNTGAIIIRSGTYNKSGDTSATAITTLRYAEGRLQTKETRSLNAKVSGSSSTYAYTEGKLAKAESGLGSKVFSAENYFYNTEGRLDSVVKTFQGKFQNKIVYQYDVKGRVSKMETLDAERKPFSITAYVYNLADQRTTEKYYEMIDGQSKLAHTCTYFYDGSGQLNSGNKISYIGGANETTSYTWEDGKPVKVVKEKNGRKSEWKMIRYEAMR